MFCRRDINFGERRILPWTETSNGVHFINGFYGAVPKFEIINYFAVRRHDLPMVAAQAVRAPLQIGVRAGELEFDQFPRERFPVNLVSYFEMENILRVRRRRAQTVNARHGCDDDDIAARQKRHRRRMAELVDLVIDERLLIYISVT